MINSGVIQKRVQRVSEKKSIIIKKTVFEQQHDIHTIKSGRN